MGKAAGGVREGFLEEVAAGMSSDSLPGSKSYVKNYLLVIHSPLPPLADILCFNHMTPLTLQKTLGSLASMALRLLTTLPLIGETLTQPSKPSCIVLSSRKLSLTNPCPKSLRFCVQFLIHTSPCCNDTL